MAIALTHWENYAVKPGSRVRLLDFSPGARDFCDQKKIGRKELRRYRREIDELAASLAAENRRSLLVIFQGMDASGKDGVVRHVFTGVNPEHCKVTSFKPPDREERAHDFLWRVVRAMPAAGEIGVFNRSQYEDVVARQARGDISRTVGLARTRQIADLERAWAENGILVRKFFLHVSRAEQGRRFQSRLDDPRKHWKVDPSTLKTGAAGTRSSAFTSRFSAVPRLPALRGISFPPITGGTATWPSPASCSRPSAPCDRAFPLPNST